MNRWALLLIIPFLLGAVHFDGSTNYVTTEYAPTYSSSDDFSISFWVKRTSDSSQEEEPLGSFGDYGGGQKALVQVNLYPTDCSGALYPEFYVRDDDDNIKALCSDTAIPTDGTWTHIAVTYDASATTSKIYMNGVLAGTDTAVPYTSSKTLPTFYIGARHKADDSSGVDTYWNGDVDEVAFWRDVLTAGEVKLLATSRVKHMPLQVSPDTLEAYYPLDEEPSEVLTLEFSDNFDDNSMSSDWSTYDCDDTSGTSFTETNQQMEIDADGADTWDPYDDYGVVYLANAITGDFDVRVKVVSQENTGDWAKAGLMVKNDMTSDGSSLGYVVTNTTPSNGWQMMWDNDSDGKLEANHNTGTMSYPSWVRIVRKGNSFSGYYSTDGTNWNLLGTESPSSPNDTVDIGMYVCSTSNGTLSLSKFDDFKLYSISGAKAKDLSGNGYDGSYVNDPTISGGILSY